MKERKHYKRPKSFDAQLRDFMKQSDSLQKDINRHSDRGTRRKRKKTSRFRREDA